MSPKKRAHKLVNFRADEATLEAIKKLAASHWGESPAGELDTGHQQSRAIRKVLCDAAARLEK